MTIAKNKPLLAKHLNLKDLLLEAAQTGETLERLLAVIPFVCKVRIQRFPTVCNQPFPECQFC